MHRPEDRRPPTSAEKNATSRSTFSVAGLFADSPKELPDAQLNILTVCTGNICRSPLAEAVLASRLADVGVHVHSAGTQALVGHGMPTPARELAERNGVTPHRAAAHRARLLDETLMNSADLVLTMTEAHSIAAVELAPRRLHRTFTVREFARLTASLDEATLRAVARSAVNSRSRFHTLVQAVADQRGILPRPVEAEDVIDPYRQSAAVYAQSESQIIPALAEVERITRIALG